MKTLFTYIGLFVLATAVSTCSTHWELRETRANEAETQEAVIGFGGYEYDSGMAAIEEDMEAEGYTLVDRTESSLWYDSTLIGIDCELGYIFSQGALVGGAMILHSATQADFVRVNNYLREIYDTKVHVEVSDGIAVAKIKAPDSMITQTLNVNERLHEIEYIREK